MNVALRSGQTASRVKWMPRVISRLMTGQMRTLVRSCIGDRGRRIDLHQPIQRQDSDQLEGNTCFV